MGLQYILAQIVNVNARNLADSVSEIFSYHIVRHSDGFKQLGAFIAGYGRDAHF